VSRTALITGANRGFGRGVALELHERGWTVLGVVRTADAHPLPVEYLSGDVTDPAAARDIALALEGRSLDLLVNNAGIDGGSHLPDEVDAEVVLRMAAVHAAGAARVTRAALPAMRRSGDAQVVNISSRLGSLALAADRSFGHLNQSIAYRMAKAALNMFTLAAAEAVGGSGIAFCAVHPGRLRTEMAAPDADLDVAMAARRLVNWLETAHVAGRFYSLDTESDLPW
jgi:NAD(P)-dependent dehydrogenase (short-subunit alcohol dehydrogenase family)